MRARRDQGDDRRHKSIDASRADPSRLLAGRVSGCVGRRSVVRAIASWRFARAAEKLRTTPGAYQLKIDTKYEIHSSGRLVRQTNRQGGHVQPPTQPAMSPPNGLNFVSAEEVSPLPNHQPIVRYDIVVRS